MHSRTPDPYLPQLRQALEHQRGNRLDDAETLYRQVLEVAPEHSLALHLLGVLLGQAGRIHEGVAALRRSVELNPRDPLAHHNLAIALIDQKSFGAAALAIQPALALAPEYVAAHCALGRALLGLRRFDVALNSFSHALLLEPQRQDALLGCARALLALGRPAEACTAAREASARQPDDLDALNVLGAALEATKQFGAAAELLERELQLRPREEGLGALLALRMACCMWQGHQALVQRIEQQLLDGVWVAQPFFVLSCSDTPEVQLQSARLQMECAYPARGALPLRPSSALREGRIKVAYLSADFHTHATAYLMAELFEIHDRSRFEIWGVSFGPSEDSALRQRLEASFDCFRDVRKQSDEQVAQLLVDQGIHIAVDLKGFTNGSRPGIFQYRPAPIVVNYLGYPGTMGAACYDYILGDPIVTPLEHAPSYIEKIVQLPGSYQVNDRKRAISAHTPTRQEAGLPEKSFVFACFNNNYKITPEIFDIWVRLLKRVEGSVLWLLADNEEAVTNLRREAAAREVSEKRLVFAHRVPLPEHLARHRLADLFLDTLPYNAHTTASDALWAGLPVLTCLGKTFQGRVAASLLTAVGLPELVVDDLAAYETLAYQLATDPIKMRGLRNKLLAQRETAPLFDTPLFTAQLEKAYLRMVERHRLGLDPQAMVIS